MKTFFSILYVPVNATLDERISIGLIISNGDQNYFRFSQSKLQIIKSLLTSETFNMLKSYFKNLDVEINQTSKKAEFFNNLNETNSQWINFSYLTYLSKYSNNLIQYSEPKPIGIELNIENFNKVFEKFIYLESEELNELPKIESIHQKVKLKLYPKIQGKVNIDRTLTSLDLPNLFAPLEVNFIGINGVTVAGQAFDFERRHYNLENDVTRFISLTTALELNGNKNGKYFVLGREPQVSHNDKNHIMWSQIRDSKFLEFIDIDEIGIVEEYIETNHVTPFFTEV